MDIKKLRNYAELIAKTGLNIMPGQEVLIRTEPEQTEFVEMLVEECYKAGASVVNIDWRFMPAQKLDINYQSEDKLSEVLKWQEEKLRYKSETLPASVYLDSDDPDGLTGIDNAKWAKAQQRRYEIIKPYNDKMENRYQWCVAAVPGKKWAKKVFPELSAEEGMEKLWELILKCSRADGDAPMEAWKEHNENLRRRCDWLNSLKLRRLIYKSESTGTDFNVGLIPEMLFCGGDEELPGHGDVRFNANIPTEEVFTTPMRGDAEGIVYSTMPLSYNGMLIENFSVRFEKGRVVEVKAEKNEEALKTMVSMDEGAAMLGECALVPWESPIRESGVLFYNTLFDENASCHLALGRGYSSCLKEFWKYTPEQAREIGVNDSMNHEDFMIGAPDLSITGICEDGTQVQIFKNGRWAEM